MDEPTVPMNRQSKQYERTGSFSRQCYPTTKLNAIFSACPVHAAAHPIKAHAGEQQRPDDPSSDRPSFSLSAQHSTTFHIPVV